MDDLIYKQTALDAIDAWRREYPLDLQEPIDDCWNAVRELPAVQPDHVADISKKVSISCGQENDLISRKAAIDAVGDWIYNPEDLRYHKEVINSIPAAQPDHTADSGKKVSISCSHENDLISRQEALKELAVYIHLIDKTMGKGTLTDDDCMEAAKSVLGEDELPAVQPEIIRCKDCKHWKNEHLCESLSRFGSFETKADFYCGYAERK